METSWNVEVNNFIHALLVTCLEGISTFSKKCIKETFFFIDKY